MKTPTQMLESAARLRNCVLCVLGVLGVILGFALGKLLAGMLL